MSSNTCNRCGFDTMAEMSPCHMRCTKCGMEIDCSDGGRHW